MKTSLTDTLNLTHPVLQAPMAFCAGGELAAAAAQGGALGLIGGGYGDADWIDAQFALSDGADIGCGIITWRLAERPWLLDRILAHRPRAVFLSFGDPAPYAADIAKAGAALICQVQTLRDARRAIDVGAAVIVAQGAEAGGHGQSRGSIALVPEIADEIARRNAPVALAAAGGISDGRGLAAALALGADGVVLGTRYWASREALVHPRLHAAALRTSGDETLRTRVLDILRGYDWPEPYTARAGLNDFLKRWHGNEAALRDDLDAQRALWSAAQEVGDPDVATAFLGEGLGMIREISMAETIAREVTEEAAAALKSLSRLTT